MVFCLPGRIFFKKIAILLVIWSVYILYFYRAERLNFGRRAEPSSPRVAGSPFVSADGGSGGF